MKIVVYRATRERAMKLLVRNKIAPAAIAIALCGGHPPVSHPMPKASHHYTTHEREVLLAKTIWAEARGGGEKGMIAVGHVIMNRIKEDRAAWGHHVEGVVRKSWHGFYQFTCWCPSDPNFRPMTNVENLPLGSADGIAYAEALQIAHMIISGHSTDPTKGATYYYASSMKTPPRWADGMKHTATWQGHEFFRPYTDLEIWLRDNKDRIHREKLDQAAKIQGISLTFELAPKHKVHKPHRIVVTIKEPDLKILRKEIHDRVDRDVGAKHPAPKTIKAVKPKAVKPKAVKHHDLDAIVTRDTKPAKVINKKTKHAPADGRVRSS